MLMQAFLLSLPLFAYAAEGGDLKAKVAACQACHGADGNKPIDPAYPKIGGQHKDYLTKALRDYRSQKRANPIMAAQVAGLSTRDLEDLAEYFSSLKGDLNVPR